MGYNEILLDLKGSIKKAKDHIPKLCYSLREEDPTLPDKEINDRVRKDCLTLGLSSDYVNECIPDEFKNIKKVEAGKKASHKKKKVVIDTQGQTVNDDTQPGSAPAKYSPVGQKKADSASSVAATVPTDTEEEEEPSNNEEEEYYNLTVYFAGKNCTLKLVIERNKIVKVIPENHYIQYSLSSLS